MAPLGINEALTYKLMQLDYLILRLPFLRLEPETQGVLLMMLIQFCLIFQEHRGSYIILGTKMVVITFGTLFKSQMESNIDTVTKKSY